MKKATVVSLYGIALYIVLKSWYAGGGKGMPPPNVLAPSTYLYTLLLILVNITGGFAVVLALGLTISLYWRANGKAAEVKPISNTKQKGNTASPSANAKLPAFRSGTF